MKKFVLIYLCIIAILASVGFAHRSVRVKKPETEEERMAHHLLHRRQPRKNLKNDLSIQNEGDSEGAPQQKFQKSKSYHFKVGPEYPDHSKRRRDYKKGGQHNIPMNPREAEAFRRGAGN